ncbi:hypothetical protein I6F26_02415 [Ensifer sp. IC3342]|nr:hypothetical protein [Ensifer sp. BRP08]MCA1445445.1 hypothetical protein [Ensifer sp. IC3342]
MLKILSIFNRAASTSGNRAETSPNWQRDPLQHPDLARMDERELADLPFPGWPWPRAGEHCECA